MIIDDIGKEGRTFGNVIQDITNYRYRYLIEHIAFDSHKITVFEDYYQYLKANSKYMLLDAKYKYKPEYLSFDEYGTTKFWELLLFVNNCYCIEEFDTKYVYIPSYDAVYEVMKNIIPAKKRDVKLEKLMLD